MPVKQNAMVAQKIYNSIPTKFISKERTSIIFLGLLFFCSNKCFADGQDGITDIVNFGYSFMIVTNVLIYTLAGGIILKFVFSKLNLNLQKINLKAFAISLVISILLTVIFKDKFTFLIFDAL